MFMCNRETKILKMQDKFRYLRSFLNSYQNLPINLPIFLYLSIYCAYQMCCQYLPVQSLNLVFPSYVSGIYSLLNVSQMTT